MYRIIISVLYVLTFTINVFSQPTLTSSISPVAGDIQYTVKADSTGITPGSPGANQFWNYANLVKLDSTATQWLLPSGTPYGSLFPAATIAGLDTCYNYFKTTPSSVELVGYYSHGTPIPYTNFETIITYPFTYNSNFTDNFSCNYNVTGDYIIRTGTANVTADAWGTINLPFGTFINTLRLKELITTYDSSTTYHMTITTNYTIYEWYAPGKKFSIFKIVYFTVIIPGFSTTSYKNVFYNPSSPLIGIIPVSTQVPSGFSLNQNYPNPFNPNTKIRFSLPKSSFAKLAVYDILGSEVQTIFSGQLKAGTYESNWDASSFPSGVYYYKLTAGNYSESRKMVLLK